MLKLWSTYYVLEVIWYDIEKNTVGVHNISFYYLSSQSQILNVFIFSS